MGAQGAWKQHVAWLRELVQKWFGEWVRNPPGPNPWHRHGEVTAVEAGGVKVRWFGEETATEHIYKCAESYTPRNVGDTVYAARSGDTWLIICKF